MIVIIHAHAPWNHPGTFRWWHYRQRFNFKVLTAKKPRGGFYDETIRSVGDVRRVGSNLPVFLWGLVASAYSWFIREDVYIYSCPPETLLIGAWVSEKILRRKVLVDMRDAIDRERQPIKRMVWFYKLLYRQMNNVVVCWQFLDPDKPCVMHGYEDVDFSIRAKFDLPYYHGDYYVTYQGRVSHKEYLDRLALGGVPDQGHKPLGYASSSAPTLKRLGVDMSRWHKEVQDHTPISWRESGKQMLNIIEEVK